MTPRDCIAARANKFTRLSDMKQTQMNKHKQTVQTHTVSIPSSVKHQLIDEVKIVRRHRGLYREAKRGAQIALIR